jgi:hypothetical protein
VCLIQDAGLELHTGAVRVVYRSSLRNGIQALIEVIERTMYHGRGNF